MTKMTETNLAHSPACERNTPPLLEFLKDHLKKPEGTFLEVGFGTGQHAFSFATSFPQLNYFASDQLDYHPHLLQRIKVLGKPENLNGPFLLKASEKEVTHNLPAQKFDTIFSANTLHIMSWKEAVTLLNFLPSLLKNEGQLFLYGPFKFSGQFTSPSNFQFDSNLKSNAPHMGIRDFEEVASILTDKGLKHHETLQMPANNNILIFGS